MKKIKKIMFENYSELLEATKGHQLTAQEVINKRTYLTGSGWQDIEINTRLYVQFCNDITNLIGDHQRTKSGILSSLLNGRPQHWGLSRMFISQYDGNFSWSYCAGQDYPSEIAQIRKSLNS